MANPTAEADALLIRVRSICFDYGGVEEKLSHGAPFFHVKGKGFVTFASDQRGDGRAVVWVKSEPDAQRRLVRSNPDVYFVPPYVGVKGWVGVRLERPGADFDELAALVEEAWRSVVPKSLATAAPRPPRKAIVYPTTDPAVVADALARLTAITDALPGTESERASHQVAFRVGKKPYAYLLDNVHRDGVVAAVFRVSREEAAALVEASPRRYFVPPYLGAKGWVAMRVDAGKTPWKELARRVAASYEAVAPKRRGGGAA
jgi:hypothetical protein